MMIAKHDTAQIPAELFTADLGAVCGSYDFDIGKGRSDIWGGVKHLTHQDWDIALVATDMQSATKSAKNIRRDNAENIFLIVQQYGQSVMQQNDLAVRLLPGDMMLVDSTQPSQFSFACERSMQVSFHLPRAEVMTRCGAGILGCGAMRSGDLTSRAIQAVLKQVCAQSDNPSKSALQRDVLYGLLGLFRMEAADTVQDGDPRSEEVICRRAEQVIGEEFRDPNLTSDRVARRIGVSLRKLQRAFNRRETTVTQAILRARLDYAKILLTAPDRDEESAKILALAFEAGFSDISYFNRRFREAYGCTPRDMRGAIKPNMPLQTQPSQPI